MSKLEEKIMNILREDKIPFIREKIFSDLRAGNLRYDFYLSTHNILIEINGFQHYKYVPKFHHKYNDLAHYQENDRYKISYALAHSIPLYIIPEWEIKYIKNSSDLFQEKFLAKSKWHNDQIYREYIKNVE